MSNVTFTKAIKKREENTRSHRVIVSLNEETIGEIVRVAPVGDVFTDWSYENYEDSGIVLHINEYRRRDHIKRAIRQLLK